MHLKRWITALVAAPVLVALISFGGPFLFAGFVSIVCILALWEYYRIVLPGREKAHAKAIIALGYVSGPGIIWAAAIHSVAFLLGLVLLNFMGCALLGVVKYKQCSSISETIAKQVLGTIYIPGLLSCLIMIQNGTDGAAWIYFLLCVVFAGDVGAFYVGTYLGRRKLCPAVSPGKTIEGAIGGISFNLGAGALFKYLAMPLIPWAASILFFVSVGVAGQIGDLFESQLKRAGNIKDSGAILPGHGGILDRIDALLFAAPVAYFFKAYVMCQ